MARNKNWPRHLTARATKTSRYYIWQPGPADRKRGWKGVKLNDAYGVPSALPAAIAQSQWLNALLDAWRAGNTDRMAHLQLAWSKRDELGDDGLSACDYVSYNLPGIATRRQVADPAKRTVARLIANFIASDEWGALSGETQRGYLSCLKGAKNPLSIEAIFGDSLVAKLNRTDFRNWYQTIRRVNVRKALAPLLGKQRAAVIVKSMHSAFDRLPAEIRRELVAVKIDQPKWDRLRNAGLATANAHKRVASVLMSFAVDEDEREDNPLLQAHGKKFKAQETKPRVVIWRPAETSHLANVADLLGEHGVADAIYIALSSCQRQGDIIALPRILFQSDRLALSQSKRGALVDIDYTPQLAARVERMKERRQANGWEHVPTMIVDDRTGKPFLSDSFGHRFLEVKRAAAWCDPAMLKNPRRELYQELRQQRRFPTLPAIERAKGEPDFLDKQFLDFRDTGITRLAHAQLEQTGRIDLLVLSSISGHSLGSITSILKHYIAMDKAMADRGIAALSSYMEREGIAV